MLLLTLYGNGLTGSLDLIAVTVCSPIVRSKLIVSAKSRSVMFHCEECEYQLLEVWLGQVLWCKL
jgi:hypothetical protein